MQGLPVSDYQTRFFIEWALRPGEDGYNVFGVYRLRGPLDTAILLYFVACGISRLARFNATAADLADESGKVKYFEGTPIPTSVLLVVVLWVLDGQGRLGEQFLWGAWRTPLGVLHPFALLYFLSGSAMISTLRIPKL